MTDWAPITGGFPPLCSQEELVRCHDKFNNQMTVLQHKLAEKGMNYETSDIAAVLNLQVPFVISAGVRSLHLHFQGHLKNNMLVQNVDPNLVASTFNLMWSSQDEVTFMSKEMRRDVKGVTVVSHRIVNNNPGTIQPRKIMFLFICSHILLKQLVFLM